MSKFFNRCENRTTTTYRIDDTGFLIDLTVFEDKDGCPRIEAWVGHEDYGVKQHEFEITYDGTPLDEFIEDYTLYFGKAIIRYENRVMID